MLSEFLKQFSERANKLTERDENVLSFKREIDQDVSKSFFDKGFWYILFIGGTDYNQYGLRILPDRKWQEWPLVSMNEEYSCTTIGVNIRNVFENIDFFTLSHGFGPVTAYKKLSDERSKIVSTFSDIIENKDGLIFFNDFVQNLEYKQEGYPREQVNELIVEYWNHFDTSEEHNFMRQTISEMITDRLFLPQLDSTRNYGIWQTRLYHMMISAITSTSTITEESITPQLLINCFDEPHCFDPVDRYNEQLANKNDPIFEMYDFAEILVESGLFNSDEYPVYHAIKGFYDKGKYGYVGVEHAELAAVMDDRYHQPLRSWNALINAAYWSGRNAEESMVPTWEAAIGLCKRNNWSDAQYVLEYQMAIYKDLQAKAPVTE